MDRPIHRSKYRYYQSNHPFWIRNGTWIAIFDTFDRNALVKWFNTEIGWYPGDQPQTFNMLKGKYPDIHPADLDLVKKLGIFKE